MGLYLLRKYSIPLQSKGSGKTLFRENLPTLKVFPFLDEREKYKLGSFSDRRPANAKSVRHSNCTRQARVHFELTIGFIIVDPQSLVSSRALLIEV